jgi:Copper amine oxidase N-terminal domain./Telomeric repeat-binding factor 2.
MKNKKTIILTIAMCIVCTVAIAAAGYLKTIEVSTDINLNINGQNFVPKDVNGNVVDIFVYEGTTYVPIRAVAEAFGLDVGYNGDTKTALINGNVGAQEAVTPTAIKSDNITLGDTFVFDGLEITIHNNVQFMTYSNEYSDKNGTEVVAVSMSIKNISDETHGLNMFYYSFYGSKGTKTDDMSFYYDDSVTNAGKVRPGATQDTKMYMVYDGNGDYYIEFSEWVGEKVEVRLPIVRP